MENIGNWTKLPQNCSLYSGNLYFSYFNIDWNILHFSFVVSAIYRHTQSIMQSQLWIISASKMGRYILCLTSGDFYTFLGPQGPQEEAKSVLLWAVVIFWFARKQLGDVTSLALALKNEDDLKKKRQPQKWIQYIYFRRN